MGESGHHVAPAVAHDRIEEPGRERLQVRAQGVDARLGEERVDERAVAGVLRRVELEREQRDVPWLRRRDDRHARDGRRERFVVERRGGHVVVAQNHPEAAVQIGAQEGMGLTERPEDALGILDELRVVVVEAHIDVRGLARGRHASLE